MPTYLMTWNSRDLEAWPDMRKDAEVVALGKKPRMFWRCGHSKTIRRGDRLILFRQGEEPKGVIGTGVAIADWQVYQEGGPTQRTRTKNEVQLEIETLIDPDLERPLTPAEMEAAGVTGVNWRPQESGTLVSESAADAVIKLWLPRSRLLREPVELSGIEGEISYRLVRHRKRERRLREAAIERALENGDGKLECSIPRCGFDFHERYGELGRGFAHVHHLGQLADRTHPSETKLSQLAIVCANCHAMIHLGGGSRPLNTLIPKR